MKDSLSQNGMKFFNYLESCALIYFGKQMRGQHVVKSFNMTFWV